MSATRLTKTGQPVLGTSIEVSLTDGTWERAKVVGKLHGRGMPAALVGVVLEWDDGVRQQMFGVEGDFTKDIGETWREVTDNAATEASGPTEGGTHVGR